MTRFVSIRHTLCMISYVATFVVSSLAGPALQGQALADLKEPSANAVGSASVTKPNYVKPTQAIKIHTYLFDTLGPYPIVGAGLAAGINQAYNTPPEWKQGVDGYARRFGSNFGIAAVSTTSRYLLAEAFREDTLYYRCQCTGFFPRLNHAVISTVIARRGEDGHRIFSIPSFVAPYAGTMTAVYAWYPNRFDARDGFRMGNYLLLEYAGANVALEFLSSGPHSLLSRMHLNNSRGANTPAPVPGTTR